MLSNSSIKSHSVGKPWVNNVSVNDRLCDLRQVTQLLRSSICESVKWVNCQFLKAKEDHIRSFVYPCSIFFLCALLPARHWAKSWTVTVTVHKRGTVLAFLEPAKQKERELHK